MKINYPKGFKDRSGFIKLSISFPEELFKEVMKMAKKEERTFNDVLIELINVGKFDIDESDRHEPKRKVGK